jgi:hypothetical protein
VWAAWLWVVCSLVNLPAAHAVSSVPYKLVASTVPEKPTKGQCGSLRLHILSAPGWVFNAKAPFQGRVRAPAEVLVGRQQLTREDVIVRGENHCTVAVPACFTAAGAFLVSWSAEFFLCTEHACEQQRITWKTAVQVAPSLDSGI